MGKRAAIYGRISDDRQGLRYGVERQEEGCVAAAPLLGYDEWDVYIENDVGASRASKKPRPKYDRIIEQCKAGIYQGIIAPSSDRLTRRPLENELLIQLYEQHGVLIHYTNTDDNDLSTARGRRRARDDAARDAEESEVLAERVVRAARQRAKQGRGNGGTRPFGWSREDRKKLDPYEHAIKLDVVRRLLAGESEKSVARALTAAAVPTATWHPPLVLKSWSEVTLREMVTNPRQYGARMYKGEYIGQGDWEPALDELTVNQLRRLLLDPSRRTSPTNVRKNLGVGLFICGDCGGFVSVKPVKRKGRPPSPRYLHAPCGLYRTQAPIDLYVEAYIKRLLRQYKPVPDPGADPAAELEAAELRAQIADAIKRFTGSKTVTSSQLEDILQDLNDQLADAEARAVPPLPIAPVLAGLTGEHPEVDWQSLPLDRKRAVINALVTVTIHRQLRGRRGFDDDSVEVRRRLGR